MPSLLDMEIRSIFAEIVKSSELSLSLTKKCVLAFLGKEDPQSVLKEVDMGAQILSFTHGNLRIRISEVLARFQPMASDLRTLISLMEISYGLVRLGRYARNIAQTLALFEHIESCDINIVVNPARVTEEMVKKAMKSVETRDVELAKEVIKMDDEVDGAYESYLRERVLTGKENIPACAVSITLILRYLERMADHAVQIAEEAMYMAGTPRPQSQL